MQFPFGVGSYDDDVPVSSFYEYLNDLSSPNFHVAEFTTIIHNMWERDRLFRKTCIYTSKNEKMAKLETIGRWRTLIHGLKTLEYKDLRKSRQQSLKANGRLYQLARRLLQKDNKMQSLKVIGRWRTLYIGLKTYDYQDLKERKIRKMQVNVTWRKMANAVLKKAYKMKSLENNMKWLKFARALLKRDQNINSNNV